MGVILDLFIVRSKKYKKLEKLRELRRLKSHRRAVCAIFHNKRAEMFKQPCPINENNKCHRQCVHFYKGGMWLNSFYSAVYYDYNMPSCKLWRKQ